MYSSCIGGSPPCPFPATGANRRPPNCHARPPWLLPPPRVRRRRRRRRRSRAWPRADCMRRNALPIGSAGRSFRPVNASRRRSGPRAPLRARAGPGFSSRAKGGTRRQPGNGWGPTAVSSSIHHGLPWLCPRACPFASNGWVRVQVSRQVGMGSHIESSQLFSVVH